MRASEWERIASIPRPVAAVLNALKFTSVAPDSLVSLTELAWIEALEFCDQSQLTLLLADLCREQLPEAIRRRTEANQRDNVARLEILQREYQQIATALESLGIQFVVLKGFSQAPWFVRDLRLRVQYDLDLLCAPSQLDRANSALPQLGFESITAHEPFPTDHLPPMVRKTGWEWRGNYFDPEIPPVIELHFRLWDEATEGFEAPGLAEFWERREVRSIEGLTIPALHPTDQFAYASLHVLRHLLRGNLKALHVYEIAHFLHTRRDDETFWSEWRELHDAESRQLQTLSCCLAAKWFDCALPDAVMEEIHALRPGARAWFDRHAACAIESRFHANKDELWLHLELVRSKAARLSVIRRRLLPLTLPGPIDSVFVPEDQMTPVRRLRNAAKYVAFLVSRVAFHTRTIAGVLTNGFRWWRARRQP